MIPRFEELISIITPNQTITDVYTGQNMHPKAFRIYGGQVLGQCIRAASDTVADDRALHSQHAYFLRPGDPKEPVTYEVDRARDGGSFSSRRVTAIQRGKPILVTTLSFQIPATAESYQPEMPEVEGPEGLTSERDIAIAKNTLNEDFMITNGPEVDVRCIGPIDWSNPTVREPKLHIWLKLNGELPDDPSLHQALLAYMSDCFLIDVALIANGHSFKSPGVQLASLDHAIWFHQPCRMDEWILHEVTAKHVGGTRGLSEGRFYNQAGCLIATTMQESLLRIPN